VIETVPELKFCDWAAVELVKLANVPNPATPAATATIAADANTFTNNGICRTRSSQKVRLMRPPRTPSLGIVSSHPPPLPRKGAPV
jgi:hypothetical protein